jgi:serine protease Do
MTTTRLVVAATFAGVVGALAVSGHVRAGAKPRANAAAAPLAASSAPETPDAVADTDIRPDEDARNPLDRTRQGVVVLERQGQPLALGTVLQGDGRILTALSSLEHGNDIGARFADGSRSRVRVGHFDRAWDLALLVPQSGRWRHGLRASRLLLTDSEASLHAFSVVHDQQLMLSRTLIRGPRTLLGGDGRLLRDALELTSQFKASDVGSPILDSKGDVMAIVARACAPAELAPCTEVPFGVPVTAIRAFLRKAPASAVPPVAWLGIRGVAADAGTMPGVRVLEVSPESPAAAAGVKSPDVLVAVDGLPITTPEQLATRIGGHAAGESVDLLLFHGGRFRQLSVTLAGSPSDNRGKPGSNGPGDDQ